MKIFPTGCNVIDDLLDGGFPSQILSLIYGDRGIGKSWLCMQLAFYNASIGKRVLVVDTEVQFIDLVVNRFYEYFSSRWNLDRSVLENIDFIFTEDIFDLCRLSGFILQVKKTDAKTIPRIKFPKKWNDKRSDRPDLQDSLQTSDWIYKSKLYNLVNDKKYDLVIIDSWTSPVKQVIESEEQNYGGRRSLESPLFKSWSTIARRLDVGMIVTGHGILFRNMIVPVPWGGSEVIGSFKIQLAIVRLSREEKKRVMNKYLGVDVTEFRNVILTRHIYKKDITPRLVRLKLNTGYIDPNESKGKVKL